MRGPSLVAGGGVETFRNLTRRKLHNALTVGESSSASSGSIDVVRSPGVHAAGVVAG